MEQLITQDTIEKLIAKMKQRAKDAQKKNKVTQPFQLFALEVAEKLNDRKNIGMYMRLTKNKPRTHIERALQYVLDSHADNLPKLFLWKIKQLRLEWEESQKRKEREPYGQKIH